MVADGKFVDAYWRQVAKYKQLGSNYIFPCDSKLPDMEVSIGSAGAVTIPGSRFKGAGVGSGESISWSHDEMDCWQHDRCLSRTTAGGNNWKWQGKYRRSVFLVDVCRFWSGDTSDTVCASSVEGGTRMDRRTFSAIDECQHPTNDTESHTCAVFQMESVVVESSSIDQNRMDSSIQCLHIRKCRFCSCKRTSTTLLLRGCVCSLHDADANARDDAEMTRQDQVANTT